MLYNILMIGEVDDIKADSNALLTLKKKMNLRICVPLTEGRRTSYNNKIYKFIEKENVFSCIKTTKIK